MSTSLICDTIVFLKQVIIFAYHPPDTDNTSYFTSFPSVYGEHPYMFGDTDTNPGIIFHNLLHPWQAFVRSRGQSH